MKMPRKTWLALRALTARAALGGDREEPLDFANALEYWIEDRLANNMDPAATLGDYTPHVMEVIRRCRAICGGHGQDMFHWRQEVIGLMAADESPVLEKTLEAKLDPLGGWTEDIASVWKAFGPELLE